MPLFFAAAAFGLSITAGVLALAALAFTVCAAIPALRRSTITAPVATLAASPLPVLSVTVFWFHHMFLMRTTGSQPWLQIAGATLTISTIMWTAGWAAVLTCRAILEYLPPLLTSLFNLQPLLLLQAVLLVGSICSAVVNMAAYGSLAYYFRDRLPIAVAIAATGALFTGICIHALLQIGNPIPYAPRPIPTSLKRLLFRTSAQKPETI